MVGTRARERGPVRADRGAGVAGAAAGHAPLPHPADPRKKCFFQLAGQTGRRSFQHAMRTMKRLSPTKHFLAATLFAAMEILNAQAAATELPAPQKTGGKPLMETLAARATRRDYNPDAPALTQAQLSNLLWAAYGINRDDGRRTAPSALNRQDITLYVLLKTGTYTYDATRHALIPVEIAGKNIGDIRAISGRQSFAGNAQLSLVYVSDFSRLGKPDADPEAREMAAISAGAIAQNAALFCASEGLLTGVRMSIDKEKLGAALGLKKSQWISLAQSVGTKDTQ